MSTEKKKHNLKTENYVLFSRFTEDPSQRYSLSDGPEGLFWAKIQFLSKEKKKNNNNKTGSRTSKHYCWLKKTRYLKLMNAVHFYFMGKYKSLGL